MRDYKWSQKQSLFNKAKADAGRRPDSATVVATSSRNEPLFKFNIRSQSGNLMEQIVHAVFTFFD